MAIQYTTPKTDSYTLEELAEKAPTENVLEEALRITKAAPGTRTEDYGPAIGDARRVVDAAHGLFGDRFQLTPEEFPLLMVIIKLSRQVNKPKRDNVVDIAGWARVVEKIENGE